jgi:hypothetical protein
LAGDARRGVRQERDQIGADRLAREEEGAQDGVQFLAVACFGQIPRAGAVDVAVGLVRDPPDRLGGAAEVEVLQRLGDQAGSVADGRRESVRVRGAR